MKEKTEIDFAKIEKKWQNAWEKKKAFEVKEGNGKKYYVLEMFPYPSASYLHMGHVRNYTMGDVIARFKRMKGFNVLYPMGYDSFGLPAENAAKKAKEHPKKYTEKAIKKIMEYQKKLGNSYDWSRVIATHKPDYYKWNQYFFLKFYEKGLVYRAKAPANWCPDCKTVLANAEVEAGKCWRCGTEVEKRELDQWFFKTTTYADELLDDLDKIDWSEQLKTMQRNWISRKEWIDIDYKIDETNETVTVSTTRPDTNFGATFVVIAPEHPLLSKEKGLVPETNRKAVEDYIKHAKKKTEEERIDEKRKKTGVFTGLNCINQLTGKKMPLWVTDFVMMNVGTGVVVGVPGHDIRDFEFAQEFNIPVARVVVGSDGDKSLITKKEQVQEQEGVIINSKFLDGLDIHQATKKIMDYLEKKKWGRRTIRYKLKDWLISRQRYWGTPIPIIYCDDCGVVPVPEKDLPIELPEDVKFSGTGNPILTSKKFQKMKCPKCGKGAKRETDTMGGFMDSSWYFLRYCDTKNKKEAFSKKKVKYWMPVDQYIGGIEHAVGHLIYSRFFVKALRDMKMLDFDEPFLKLFNQGVLYKDGRKMSKSYGNTVTQEDVSKRYGIDTARMFLLFVSAGDSAMEWTDEGIAGVNRFIKRIFSIEAKEKADKKLEHYRNKMIKEISEDIANFRFNLALIKLMKWEGILQEGCDRKSFEDFLKIISVFAPHIAEELWERIGGKGFVSLASWPVCDESKIDEELERQEAAVEKLAEDINHVVKLVGKKMSKAYVYVLPKELSVYAGCLELVKKKTGLDVVVFAVNDKDKYDPEGKSGKAKVGKPALFLE